MSLVEGISRRAQAAVCFNEHEHRDDGTRLANCLADGLNLLRDLFFTRVHSDVETAFGMDSMLAPISPVKTEANSKMEIDIYQVAESVELAQARHYIGTSDEWYAHWLGKLRLGEGLTEPGVAQRLAYYANKDADGRRRAFSQVLERALPEASRAPLIIYRLLPLAVTITSAIAFGDHVSAQAVRKRQMLLLSSIGDCHECRGALLDIGEQCPQCGNPFWKYAWLTAE